MDLKALDKDLQEIAKLRNTLAKVDYNNPKYDEIEEQLHELEDAFQDNHGDDLEDVLQDIHDKICPDTDVLYPIAYFAKTYLVNAKNEFSVTTSEGVFVEVDAHEGKDTKLVIIPSPLRVALNIGKELQQIVWSAQ